MEIDKAYEEKMMQENRGLVHHIISKEFPTLIGDEDVEQDGMIGLLNAIRTWNEERGAFSTYACACIHRSIATPLRKCYSKDRDKTVLISLYMPIKNDPTNDNLIDFIVGDKDVDYFDDSDFIPLLTKTELEVYQLLKAGYSTIEIKNIKGVTRQCINGIMKRIQKKWIKYYGEDPSDGRKKRERRKHEHA